MDTLQKQVSLLQKRVDLLEQQVNDLRADKQEIINNFHAFCHVVKKRMAEVEGRVDCPTDVALSDEEDGEL